MDGSVLGCDRSALNNHPLVGLHQVAEVRLGHLSAVNPKASPMESHLNILHLLYTKSTRLGQLGRFQVHGGFLQQDRAAGGAVPVAASLVS